MVRQSVPLFKLHNRFLVTGSDHVDINTFKEVNIRNNSFGLQVAIVTVGVKKDDNKPVIPWSTGDGVRFIPRKGYLKRGKNVSSVNDPLLLSNFEQEEKADALQQIYSAPGGI